MLEAAATTIAVVVAPRALHGWWTVLEMVILLGHLREQLLAELDALVDVLLRRSTVEVSFITKASVKS